MQCLILAGGLGTRMKDHTQNIPKALISVAGQPFAFHQLRQLAFYGVKSVIYSIGYRGEMIREAIADGRNFGLKVEYVDEDKELMGTGGAIRKALDAGVLEENFFVLYGDSYLPISFRDVYAAYLKAGKPALMTYLHNEGRWDKSNVRFEGEKMIYEKGCSNAKKLGVNWIDYGLSVLSKQLVSDAIPPRTQVDLAVPLHSWSTQGLVKGYEVFERFYEIGSPSGLHDLEQYLKLHPTKN